MIADADFYAVLKQMAKSLIQINENLEKMTSMKKAETYQIIRESKKRMSKNRILISESQRKHLENEVMSILREDKNKNK